MISLTVTEIRQLTEAKEVVRDKLSVVSPTFSLGDECYLQLAYRGLSAVLRHAVLDTEERP